MTATLNIVADYMKELTVTTTNTKTYKSGETIARDDIMSIIQLTKTMASGKTIALTDAELNQVQLTVNGNALPVDTTPYVGTNVVITITFNGKSGTTSVYVEGTIIKATSNGNNSSFENGKVFINQTALTWSTNEIGTLTYPDGHTETYTQGTTLTLAGQYTITVGNVSKTFEIEIYTIDNYISIDTATKTLTITDLSNVTSITIAGKTYTGSDLVDTYSLSRGRCW